MISTTLRARREVKTYVTDSEASHVEDHVDFVDVVGEKAANGLHLEEHKVLQRFSRLVECAMLSDCSMGGRISKALTAPKDELAPWM